MDMKCYAQRREHLIAMVGKGAVIVVPGYQECLRNGDAYYPFRQSSDFYYLTGFLEPEALLVLVSHENGYEFILFNRPNDEKMETWNGKRAGQEGACKLYGADRSFPYSEINQQLPCLLAQCQRIYYPLGNDIKFDQVIIDSVSQLASQQKMGELPKELHSINPFIHQMRLLKSEEEIELMRKGIELSAKAHCRAMYLCKPGMKEYELEAEIMHTFLKGGSRAPAYSSIIAGGDNACTLHYTENSAVLKSGDLVLIDAGAEYGGYAADITRTFPVNGCFTKAQKQVYEVVLDTQLAVIAQIKPGILWDKLQQTAVIQLTEGLVKLGILSGKVETLIQNQAYEEFYMHRVGHWLGLDVHDVGTYKVNGQSRPLEAGMVLTVEPGLYIKSGNPNIDPQWWGIGIRIEDDVLVTSTGAEVLSCGVPKEVDEIEQLMKTEPFPLCL